MNKKEESKKSISVNAVFNVIYKLLNALFPLITATYVARVLLPAGVGKVSYAQNIVMYFTYIAALGLPTYGTREIAKRRGEEIGRNRIFTELFLINAISTSCCVIIYYSFVSLYSDFTENRLLHYVAGIAIILNYINVDWVYQGFEEYKYIAIRSMIIKCVSVVSIFVFVRNQDDFVIYALIHCLATAGNYVFNIFHLHKYIKFDFKNIKITQHLKPLFTLLSASIAIELYTLLDTTMLGALCSDDVVGYYSNAIKTVKIVITVLAAVISVMLPRLSWYYDNHEMRKFNVLTENVIKVLFMLAVPSAIGVLGLSGMMMPVLFGKAFIPAVPTLRILSILIIPIPFSTLFGTQILCAVNQEKKMLIAVMCGAISNICMNTILIPLYQQNGAAIASVISECLVAIIEIVFVKKVLNIHIKIGFYNSCIISTVTMLFAITLTNKLALGDFLGLFVSFVVGCIAYLGTMLLTKNEGIMIFLNTLKTRSMIQK